MKRPEGLTNKIILKNKVLTKISNPNVDYFLNRLAETKLYDQLKNINTNIMNKPLNYYFDKDNNFISEWSYIDNTFTFIDQQWLTRENSIQDKVIKTINELHSLNIELPIFNPKEYLEKFTSKIKNTIVNLETYQKMLEFVIENYYQIGNKVFSHNDLTPGNFLFTNDNNFILIDFEYASINNELFDFASFITETLPPDEEEIFIKKLNLKNDELKQLRYIIFYQYILWINWANYMYEATNKEIYKDIVFEKYNRLINDIKLKDLEF